MRFIQIVIVPETDEAARRLANADIPRERPPLSTGDWSLEVSRPELSAERAGLWVDAVRYDQMLAAEDTDALLLELGQAVRQQSRTPTRCGNDGQVESGFGR